MVLLLGGAWSVSRGSGAPPPPPTGSWQLEAPAEPAAVEGYASDVSMEPGETLQLHVSTTPAARYRVEVYRIGWYEGTGGALVGCLPGDCAADAAGEARPVPSHDPATGELRAGWPVTDAVEVPAEWRSGYYLAKVVLTSGPEAGRSAGVPFVVRAPAG